MKYSDLIVGLEEGRMISDVLFDRRTCFECVNYFHSRMQDDDVVIDELSMHERERED